MTQRTCARCGRSLEDGGAPALLPGLFFCRDGCISELSRIHKEVIDLSESLWQLTGEDAGVNEHIKTLDSTLLDIISRLTKLAADKQGVEGEDLQRLLEF